MTTPKILFGIAIPVTIAIIALIIFGSEIYISWQLSRPVKKRKQSDKEKITMNEQIEKMANILCDAKDHDCTGGDDCLCVRQAKALYDSGCRIFPELERDRVGR